MKNSKNSIGDRIKRLRELKGLTQLQLGEKLFVSDKAISKWEKGSNEPDSETLVKMSSLFDVTLDYLLTGNEPNKDNKSISKIELACREDNIALLEGIDLEAFDGNGKNLSFYIDKYHAKNVGKYFIDYGINKASKEGNLINKEYYIIALPKDKEDEEDYRVVAKRIKYSDIVSECASLEKKGYHSFKVYRMIDPNEEVKQDYQYFFCNCLGPSGFNTLQITVGILDDGESGILKCNYYFKEKLHLSSEEESNISRVTSCTSMPLCVSHVFVRPHVMKEFMELLSNLNVVSWENKSWGCPICDLFYLVKDLPKDNDLYCHKFYVDPGEKTYKKFIKGIQKLCFDSMFSEQYKEFTKLLCTDYRSYCRHGMSFDESERLFKGIEKEQREIKNGRFEY